MLILHRSERADQLVENLGRLLRDPLDDPVTAEVVAVPTRGVERWITQRLSHLIGTGPGGTGGVCANLDFPFPGTLVGRATALATGIDPESDPWAADRLVWPLVEVLDERVDDPALAPLVQHLAAATPPPRPGTTNPAGLRRYATARHVADLFDRYSVHRPDMIRQWAAGDDGGAGAAGAGWQPHLWRLVRAAVAVPSPAERLPDAVARMVSDPDRLDLPQRLSVFGLTRLPAGHLAVLEALARQRDVHMFLLHPSGALWERTAPLLADEAPGGPPPDRDRDSTARLPRHPLLRSWGRDAREMQVVLSGVAAGRDIHHPVPADGSPGLLARIQEQIRTDTPPAGVRRPLEPSDRSLQVHSCHGRMRQVEVLRDAVLHLLQDDPTLEARDVIVMCPDIETFAPLIEAAFGVHGPGAPAGGRAGPDPGEDPVLRVRLADRSLRQTNPLLAVAAAVLELAGSRVTAPAVMDLAARPPVSRRFRFDQEDLSTIERWVAGTAIRWGVDGAHRTGWALGRLEANTWSAGLDRLMLGVAVSEGESLIYRDTVPYGDMGSGQTDLAGRLTEMVSRVGRFLDRLSGRMPLRDWVDALVEGTESLALAGPEDGWQHEELRSALAEAAGQPATGPGPEPLLALDEVRFLLAEQLRGRPTRANFRTGDLTICTLVPMRSVPHRVVALLGLDDGAFPRHTERDGDDILLATPRVGDRDARSEDRQLLLDALLAARDRLIITYCGRDERTNRLRPPCPPVAELLDLIDATAVSPAGTAGHTAVVVEHPLQAFDPRSFTPGPGRDRPWGFDQVSLAGAVAAQAARPAEPRTATVLPPLAEPVIGLEDLISFVTHPARAFLRRRFSLYLGDRGEDLSDCVPLELDALERWSLGDRLLDAVLAGADLERAREVERRRGLLPPGGLGDGVLDDVCSTVSGLAATLAGRGFPPGPFDAAHVRVDLPDGRQLVGTVPRVREDTIVQCTYSKVAAKHRLPSWLRFLALTADHPDRPVSAVTVGRGPRSAVSVAVLDPLPGDPEERRRSAVDRLAPLVALYEEGMRAALPLACATSAAWCEAGRSGGDPEGRLQAARWKWEESGDIPGERDDPEHVFLYGRYADVRLLMRERPGPAEDGPGWAADERTRFGRLARRLWDPLLAHERLAHG